MSNVNFKWALHSWKIPLHFVGLTVSYILYAAVNACNYKILQNILVSNKCSWTNISSLTGMTFSHGFRREKKRRRFVMVMVSDDDRRWVNFSCRLHRLMFRRHGLSMEWCVYVWISLKNMGLQRQCTRRETFRVSHFSRQRHVVVRLSKW